MSWDVKALPTAGVICDGSILYYATTDTTRVFTFFHEMLRRPVRVWNQHVINMPDDLCLLDLCNWWHRQMKCTLTNQLWWSKKHNEAPRKIKIGQHENQELLGLRTKTRSRREGTKCFALVNKGVINSLLIWSKILQFHQSIVKPFQPHLGGFQQHPLQSLSTADNLAWRHHLDNNTCASGPVCQKLEAAWHTCSNPELSRHCFTSPSFQILKT